MPEATTLLKPNYYFMYCTFCKTKQRQYSTRYTKYGQRYLIQATCETCSRPNTSMRGSVESDYGRN